MKRVCKGSVAVIWLWKHRNAHIVKGSRVEEINRLLQHENLIIVYFVARSQDLPRRGRIKEGEALAVYFAMNISSVFGVARSSR